MLKGAELPKVCRDYPEFLAVVLEGVLSPQDDSVSAVAVDTLGVLGSTPAGRKALEGCESQTRDAIKWLGELVANAQGERRTRALGAMAMFLSCKEEPGGASKSREWFNLVHPKFFSILMSILRQPFRDLQLAGLHFLLSLAPYQWFQVEMQGHPGFLEYLLDRQTQEDKEGKELKYEIVHTLVGSGTAEEVFGAPDYLKLRQYDMEGPFFVISETVVATEGSV